MIERWWWAPGAAERLGPAAREDVGAWMRRAEEGECLSSDRSAVAARVVVGGEALLVKWRRPRRGRRLRTWLRPSRERLEARVLDRLAGLGVAVPRVLGVGERRARGVLIGAVLVRDYAPGTSAAVALGEAPDLAADLGGAWRRWHDLGLRHGDAYPKNVLRSVAGTWMPIGCPKARLGAPGVALDGGRVRDLAQMQVGLEELGLAPAAFLAGYAAGDARLSPARLAAALGPRAALIRRRKRRRREAEARGNRKGPRRPQPLPPGPAPRSRPAPWARL